MTIKVGQIWREVDPHTSRFIIITHVYGDGVHVFITVIRSEGTWREPNTDTRSLRTHNDRPRR